MFDPIRGDVKVVKENRPHRHPLTQGCQREPSPLTPSGKQKSLTAMEQASYKRIVVAVVKTDNDYLLRFLSARRVKMLRFAEPAFASKRSQ